ncbi:MFS transporter [Kitasatospora sp. MMS16-BH015]|uniref:MFS transporter n=1 Tax=Kitasatospora sp. MMS16-BH015 TaxID=2018025 RepID=UPI000CA1F741|nr:MFS transporter [Kitasatospora sp. MMS16-BH015]AUG75717.1 MFS transporter [Kitasatospora sp. MMS16-BH015]
MSVSDATATRTAPTRRDVRLWITGTSVSLFGDAALWIALGIWVHDLTGSNGAAGLAFAAYVVPRLGAPFLGLVVDRYRRRPLIALLNLLLAGWVSLAFLVQDRNQVWLLYLVLFGVGLGVGMHNAAGSALLTNLVHPDQLGRTNALLRTVQEGGMLVSPAIGSRLYVWAGPRAVAGLEAVTFLVCCLCVLAVRVDEPRPEPPSGSIGRELVAGVQHLARTPRLRAVSIAMGGGLLGFGFIETVIYAVADQGLHRAAAFVGWLTAAKGLGSVLGGVLGMRVLKRLGPGRESALTVRGLSLMAAGCAILVLPGVVLALLGVFVIGLGIPGAVVGLYTSMQRYSPAHLQGRVSAAASMLATTPQVLAVATSAALIASVDYRVLLGVMVLLISVSAAYLAVRSQSFPDTGESALATPVQELDPELSPELGPELDPEGA